MKRFLADRWESAMSQPAKAPGRSSRAMTEPPAPPRLAGRRWGVFTYQDGWNVRHEVRADDGRQLTAQ